MTYLLVFVSLMVIILACLLFYQTRNQGYNKG